MPENERASDTAETFGSQSPPSGVSNQNTEEEGAPGVDGQGRHTKDEGDGSSKKRSSEAGRPGGAGESSQATGHPQNAG